MDRGRAVLTVVILRRFLVDDLPLDVSRSSSYVRIERTKREIELPEGYSRRIWPLTVEQRLRRRKWSLNRKTLSSTLYGDELDGLVLVEVDFRERSTAEAYIPSAFVRTGNHHPVFRICGCDAGSSVCHADVNGE